MRSLRLVATVALCAASAWGCSSCKRSVDSADASSQATLEIAPGMALRPWGTTETSAAAIALPTPCKLLPPPRFRPAEGEPVVFAAADGELRSLAVASLPASGQLPPTRGIVDTSPHDASAAVRDIPWLDVHAPPVMAASKGRWLALVPQSDPFSPTVRLWLWREGLPIATLAEGDGLAAIDARCGGEICAVLTTRVGSVAAGGATLWTGAWGDAPDKWARTDLAGGVVPSDAKGVSIARFSGPQDLTVAFESAEGINFTRIGAQGLTLTGKVGRDDALLDVALTASTPVALSMRAGAEACASNAIVVRAPDKQPIVLPLTARPLAGYAREVGAGVLVAWSQPVDCRSARRVIYAIVLGAEGVPLGSMTAIADGDGFAMATAGEEARIWLRSKAGVTQIDARCEIPASR